MDFRGDFCGVGKLANKPYLYYLTPEVDINFAICVEQCPSTTVIYPLPIVQIPGDSNMHL
jgi:hypothetical protein